MARFTGILGSAVAAAIAVAGIAGAVPAQAATNQAATNQAATKPAPKATPATQRPGLKPADLASIPPGVLFGAAIPTTGSAADTETAMSEQEAQLGRKMDLHRVYRLWDDEMPDTVLRTDVARGRVPLLSIKPKTGNGKQISWAAIARGDADTDIRRQAAGIASLGAPVLLAFHHEPDLGSNASYGKPAEYVAAYRHYRAVFEAAGVRNVAFAWVVTTTTFGRAGATDSFYPGDDVVDWIGVDAFNWFGCSEGQTTGWRSLQTVIAPFAAWAKPHNKPLVLAEWGSVEDPADPGRKAAWIRDAMSMAKALPQLRAMSYLDAHGSCPWWIDSSRSTLDAFTEAGNDAFTHLSAGALLNASTRLGAAPLKVSFDGSRSTGSGSATGSGVDHWTLDFGDRSTPATGTGQPPARLDHTYAAGAFTPRLTVVDGLGGTGSDTGSVKAADKPVTTLGVRDLTTNSVTLRTWVSPQGLPGTARFDWGTSATYGKHSDELDVDPSNGTVTFAVGLTGLTPGTRYYLRVSATTAAGTTTADSTFDTPGAPTVGYGTPTGVGKSGATFTGWVHPHSLDSSYYYEYGSTDRYGARTAATDLESATWARSAPAAVSGLAGRSTYHYRLVATNSLGTTYGPDQTVGTR
jgi:hypothetical protein